MKRTQPEEDEEEETDNKRERKKPRKRKQYDGLVGVFKQHGSTAVPSSITPPQQSQTNMHTARDPSYDLTLRTTEHLDGGGTYSEFVFSNARSVFVNELEDTSSPVFHRITSPITPPRMHVQSYPTVQLNTLPQQTTYNSQTQTPQLMLDSRVISQHETTTFTPITPALLTSPNTPTPTSADSTTSSASTTSEEEQREKRRQRISIKNLLN
jgi:hypothetical protein